MDETKESAGEEKEAPVRRERPGFPQRRGMEISNDALWDERHEVGAKRAQED